MSVVVRGAKNAFRNWLRTGAVVLILAIGIGLSLSMLVAKQAVEARMSDLKSQVGTKLTVNPAGAQGMQGGGEPLTNDQLAAIKTVAHVSQADASVNFTLRNQDSSSNNFSFRGGQQSDASVGITNLQSSIDPGTLGRRFASSTSNDGTAAPANFSLPIRGIGTNSSADEQGNVYKITSGRALVGNDTTSAIIGSDLATKNNLKVGSTFIAYDTTFTVVGIFDQGTKFANDTIAIPLAQAQQLSGQTNELSSVLVTVDSIENLNNVSDAIKAKLGNGKVDVTSSQQNIQTAIDSLQSVQQVSLIGFIAALVAAAIITFLIMLVIVRERRREIGVLKAIGGSNRTIVAQFVVEALVLVILATVVGMGITLVSSNSIANALVSNSSTLQTQTPMPGQGRAQRTFRVDASATPFGRATSLVGQVTASVGPMTLLWGVLAALGIAVVGSAVPAWLISRVRPAEVMRGE